MKAAEMREMSREELEDLDQQLRSEHFQLKLQFYTGQLQKTSELRNKRRDIARVQTILQEIRLEAGEVQPKPKRNRRRRAQKKLARRRAAKANKRRR